MSLEQYFGRWGEQAHTIGASGVWSQWVSAQPALGQVRCAAELGAVVTDRGQQAQANDLLVALVRIGSVDGGVDQRAATFVASLLVPGGNRIIRSLTGLGPDVDAIVAGQLWIQVREYPWRDRPRAVAKNTLMETRRAVLDDYGATTARRSRLVPIAPDVLTDTIDQRPDPWTPTPTTDIGLLGLLAWARARSVLAREDARLLWELVLAADEDPDPAPEAQRRGVTSVRAGLCVATARGVAWRTVERRRDRAVDLLRQATDDYESTGPTAAYPPGVAVLTGAATSHRKGGNR